MVTAGICLALDLFHRSEKDTEVREHLSWVERTIKILEQWPTSSVATHGVRLLSSLHQEYTRKFEASRATGQPAPSAPAPRFPENISPAGLADAACEAERAQSVADVQLDNDAWLGSNLDVDMLGFEDLMDTLPMEAGFDNNVFFESMLSLANSHFS